MTTIITITCLAICSIVLATLTFMYRRLWKNARGANAELIIRMARLGRIDELDFEGWLFNYLRSHDTTKINAYNAVADFKEYCRIDKENNEHYGSDSHK